MGAARIGAKVYLAGGFDNDYTPKNDLLIYDLAADSWSSGPPLPVPLHHSAMAAINGKAYVMGGINKGANDPWLGCRRRRQGIHPFGAGLSASRGKHRLAPGARSGIFAAAEPRALRLFHSVLPLAAGRWAERVPNPLAQICFFPFLRADSGLHFGHGIGVGGE